MGFANLDWIVIFIIFVEVAVVSTVAVYFYFEKISIKHAILIFLHGLGGVMIDSLVHGRISTVLAGNSGFIIYALWQMPVVLLCLYLVKKDFLKSAYALALPVGIGLVNMIIVSTLFSMGLAEFHHYPFITIFTSIIFVIIIKKIMAKFTFFTTNKIFITMFNSLVCLLVLIPFLGFVFNDELIATNPIVTSILIVATGTVIAIIIGSLNRYMRNVKHEAEQNYIKEVEERQLEIRRFRHDYLHLLSTMKNFISDKDFEGLEQYYNSEIMPTTEWLNNQNIELGNLGNLEIKEIKSLLSMKLMQAQTLQIETIIEIPEVINVINMKSSLLARILGNLLDNAIEESVHNETPTLNFALLDKEDHQLIVVRNTCRNDVPTAKRLFEKGFSTKGDNRGMGLSTVKQIIGKLNHVSLTTKAENGYFVQELKIEN